MERQLLALIHSLARRHPRGEADAATCLQQLGIGHREFFRLVDYLEEKGYLDAKSPDGWLKLSAKGERALEKV